MEIETEEQFLEWISIIVDLETVYPFELNEIPDDMDECEQVVRFIEQQMYEQDFRDVLLYADNNCACSSKRRCSFCKIFEVTQHLMTPVYCDLELLDVQTINNLL